MPAAGDVGAGADLLDWVLTIRPDLAPALHRVLASGGGSADDLVAGLHDSDPTAYQALIVVVLAGYYFIIPTSGLGSVIRARFPCPSPRTIIPSTSVKVWSTTC